MSYVMLRVELEQSTFTYFLDEVAQNDNDLIEIFSLYFCSRLNPKSMTIVSPLQDGNYATYFAKFNSHFLSKTTFHVLSKKEKVEIVSLKSERVIMHDFPLDLLLTSFSSGFSFGISNEQNHEYGSCLDRAVKTLCIPFCYTKKNESVAKPFFKKKRNRRFARKVSHYYKQAA